MLIELKGVLPKYLTCMGIQPGQRFNAKMAENTSDKAMQFQYEYNDEWIVVTVQPKNYKKL